ncbi:MAG: hypothetical protein RUMPE_01315 [Eubacteriales bacterium SKADARSKE-1]|nr:hypothetical protein [Eubacteriales bacterium SKADARSKE-1]
MTKTKNSVYLTMMYLTSDKHNSKDGLNDQRSGKTTGYQDNVFFPWLFSTMMVQKHISYEIGYALLATLQIV